MGQFLTSKHLSLSLESIIKDEGELTCVGRSGTRQVVHVFVQDVTGNGKEYAQDESSSLSCGPYVELRDKDKILIFVNNTELIINI